MSDSIVALVDCNNFYCACERLFDPSVRNRPIVVLSNNDGCIISRSEEAKSMGLAMTTPIHHVQELVQKYRVVVRSSNYTLYQDISDRVMQTLAEFSPRIEVYSIDEAFIDLSKLRFVDDLNEYGLRIKSCIKQWVGVPVCIGIARTKTLAKLANHAAKKYRGTRGVADISDPQRVRRLLSVTPVQEVWGIGKRQSAKLENLGIHTALELADTSPKRIRKHFSVVMERTQRELNGESCLPLHEEQDARKHILCSRAFGERLQDPHQVQAALSFHVCRAASKLRKDRSLASRLRVSLKTNPYSYDDEQYQAKREMVLPQPSDDTLILVRCAKQLLEAIWKPGYNYHKVSVVLSDLVPAEQQQGALFMELHEQANRYQNQQGSRAISDVMDKLNSGNELVLRTASSLHTNPKWPMRRQSLSPRYTTRWSDIPTAR